MQIAEQKAQRVAQLAVVLAHALHQVLARRNVLAEVNLATHSRMISAPSRLATSTGSTPLPSDFEKARPCSSSVQPEVATILYGACPRTATEVSREEWNQPRCWSPPSV